jgi:hypothetical protein
VFSREVLKMINEGKPGWEPMLPSGIAEIIKTHFYDPNKVLKGSTDQKKKTKYHFRDSIHL